MIIPYTGKLSVVGNSANFDAGLYDITGFPQTDVFSIYLKVAVLEPYTIGRPVLKTICWNINLSCYRAPNFKPDF